MPIPDMARRCCLRTDGYGFHNCKKRILDGNPFCAVIVLSDILSGIIRPSREAVGAARGDSSENGTKENVECKM